VPAPMRRTILLALVATLLLAPTAFAASREKIWSDCQDDSVLQGHYTTAELRDARAHLPADIAEYSDCRDVLSRAIAAKTSPATSPASSGGSGGGGGGGTSSGGGSGGGASPSHTDSGGAPVTPSTPQDQAALTEAATKGAAPVTLNGQAVLPGGKSRLAADLGRNPLPTALVVVLIVLALAAALGGGLRIRNRVIGHRQA
jgi:hypothetical protein